MLRDVIMNSLGDERKKGNLELEDTQVILALKKIPEQNRKQT